MESIMQVEKMGATDWSDYVGKEFNKIVMCKVGQLKDAYNRHSSKEPRFTKEEEDQILKDNSERIKIEMKGRLQELINDMDVVDVESQGMYEWLSRHDISYMLSSIIDDFKLSVHPDEESWERERKRLNEEVNTREAVLRKDAENIIRDFTIGIREPKTLNDALEQFEKAEY
jgi:hypothetical protein